MQSDFRQKSYIVYLLGTHVLVLFLTGFPNLELYFSVLHFQFLILESTKQVVSQQLLGQSQISTTAFTEHKFHQRSGNLESRFNFLSDYKTIKFQYPPYFNFAFQCPCRTAKGKIFLTLFSGFGFFIFNLHNLRNDASIKSR